MLHVIVGLEMGGAESMLYKMIEGAGRYANSETHAVLSLRTPGIFGPKLEGLGIRVYSLDLSPGQLSLVAIFRLARVISTLRPDVVHCWMYHAMLAGSLVKLFRMAVGFQLIWNIRNALHHEGAEKKLTNMIIRVAGKLSFVPSKIVYNSYVSREQHSRIGYKEETSVVIPNGFDIEKFHPDASAKSRLCGLLGVPREALLVGIVGRYHGVKGFNYFIEAAARVSEELDVTFVMIGDGLTEENDKLRSLLDKYCLQDRVRLLGLREDVHRLLPGLTVFVNSSASEAFANVIGEAMSCGVPCVATDVGDSRRIVGECGIVVQPRDAGRLADGILSLLRLDQDKRNRLGQCGRKAVVEKYAIPTVVGQYSMLYRTVAGGTDNSSSTAAADSALD